MKMEVNKRKTKNETWMDNMQAWVMHDINKCRLEEGDTLDRRRWNMMTGTETGPGILDGQRRRNCSKMHT